MSRANETYYQIAEEQYIVLLQQLIGSGQTNLDVVSLIQTRIDDEKVRGELLQAQIDQGINNETAKELELKACRTVIAYYQEVKFVQALQVPVTGQGILEDRRNALKLPTTIKTIEDLRLDLDPYQAKLQKYDYALRAAIQRDGVPVQSSTTWELQRLQILLGIADQNIIPPEALRSEFRIDYIPIWRRLEAKQWLEANHETQRLIVEIARQNRPRWLPQTKKWQKSNQAGQQQMLNTAQQLVALELEDLQHFPCLDLFTIDYLWLKFSEGYYGFSLQRQIWWWLDDDWEQFTQQVGWLTQSGMVSNTQLRQSPKPERAQLPYLLPIFQHNPDQAWAQSMAECLFALILKLETCPIRATA